MNSNFVQYSTFLNLAMINIVIIILLLLFLVSPTKIIHYSITVVVQFRGSWKTGRTRRRLPVLFNGEAAGGCNRWYHDSQEEMVDHVAYNILLRSNNNSIK